MHRLVSIAHSYCVALNRRLAHEMARAGAGEWEVTAVAPSFFHGDLRPIVLEPQPGEFCRLIPLRVRLTWELHLFFYERKLRAILNDGFDLVHCWEEPYVIAGAQVARWAPRKTPFVFWTAQNISKSYPPPFSMFERFCLQRCRGWLAPADSVARAMLGRGYGKKPHRVIPLGVDAELFSPDRELRAATKQSLGWETSGAPVVGYLGRFVKAKGLQIILRILNTVKAPWRALFVGGGEMEAELQQWAKRHGDRVRILTDVEHDRVPACLNAMDVLLAPSQTTPQWREQFGRMVIEAFACGVPVIASDSGEIPNVVGDAGVVLGEHDEQGWAQALSELLENPAQRSDLASRGLARVHDMFTWPIVARRHLDFFSELLDTNDKISS